MKILNLTQHEATPEQVKAGVVEPTDKNLVKHLLTFDELPTPYTIMDRASNLAKIAEDEGAEAAMIGGAPFLMSFLVVALEDSGIQPLFAFSQRESVEETQKDGSVTKKNVFRHLGFVEV